MLPNVREILKPDLPAVAEFLSRQVRAGEAVSDAALTPEQRLRWLLLDCPQRPPEIPLGWLIRRHDGAVVGAAVCVPFQIGVGEHIWPALMFAKFFVDPPYRGMGLGILMRFIRLGVRYPLFVTSTNAVAGQLFQKLGATQINGMDHTMLGIARAKPLAEEWLHRRTHNAMLARLLSLPAIALPGKLRFAQAPTSSLQPITSPDDAFLTQVPPTTATISFVHDPAYIRWRYFSGDPDKEVYRFRVDSEQDRLVVVNRVKAGYRGQIRVVNVLDVWPPTTQSSAPALAAALTRQYQGTFDAIWLRSQPPSAEEALEWARFVRHDFPAPLGWFIDREKRLPTEPWYLMPGESE